MYSRFWHKFLYDKGLVPTNEPFRKLINQGMIQGIIESMYLQKEKDNGFAKFVCADLAKAEGLDHFTTIPVHVDFVKNYGDQSSYMNLDSIQQFIDWRPEYKDAIFECGKGIYHKGVFTAKGEATESHLITKSEVGKMSKRYYNVVNPDDVVARYGSDCFRMYEMFLGPVEQSKPWDTKGIDGVSKFLRKFWGLFHDKENNFSVSGGEPSKEELKVLHTAIKKIGEDIERFSFNTCVSAFMIATNEMIKLECSNRTVLTKLVQLIAPFAPHIAEELWSLLGHEASVHSSDYPVFDPQYLVEDAVEYPISINGKLRTKATFPTTASIAELEKLAMDLEVVQKWTDGQTVRKIIVVPQRMINIVVG
jgi:leucyl-tRNA synthetase